MKRLLLLFSVFLLGLAGILNAQTINPGYIDGHLYFKFNDDYDFRIKVNENTSIDFDQMPVEFKDMFERYGVTLITRPLYVFNDPQLERVIRLEFTDAQNIDMFIKELELNENVEYAEKVPYYKKMVTYNDPYYTSSTYSGVIPINYKWHLEMINAPQAWGIQQGSSNIKVAIVDNAVWGAHSDLNISSSNMCSFATGTQSNGNSAPPTSVSQTTNCTQETFAENCPAYEWSHGTHCAGLVGAINNNGVGISSIGGGVTLMGVRGANNDEEMYYCINGVAWAANNGAKVISMSFGSTGDSYAERTTLQSCYNNGVILVAAAGNEGDQGNEINYPAGYSFVISVASVDSNGKLSDFSQYGSGRADVAAPGGFQIYNYGGTDYEIVNILSTTYCKSQYLRLYGLEDPVASGQYYDGMQGTSMATPIVAGLCGLMASAYPDITPDQAKQCLISTGTALASGSNSIDNNVYVNAYAAVQCAQSYSGSLVATPTTVTLPSAGGSQTVSVRAGTSSSSWNASSNQSWLTVSPTTGNGSGATTTMTVTANSANTTGSPRTATVTITQGSSSVTVTVTQNDNSDLCITANEEIMEDDSLAYKGWCSNVYASYFTKFAQKIDVTGNYTLDKITLYDILNTATSNSVAIKVWSANTSGLPDTELYSQTINISTLNNALTQGQMTGGTTCYYGTYEHNLSSPITVSGPFFVGWDVAALGESGENDANQMILSSTSNGTVMTNSLYTYFNNAWRLVSTIFQNPPTNVAAAFLPHICPTDEQPNTLTVSPSSLSYSATGESKTVTVTSNTSWTATSSASWLTISPASGSNNGTITAVAAANTSTSQRTATITVSGTGVSSQTISVIQAGTSGNPVSSFTYDFEACTSWAVDDFSPCTTYDGDGSATYGIQGAEFENANYVGSYIAFENGISGNFVSHGGTKFGSCMDATEGLNDDWFILPAISVSNGTTFSFWAKSVTDQWGLERFNVLLSTTNNIYSSFTVSLSGNSYLEAPVEWTQYSYDLSSYNGQTVYLAIQCVSADAFAFLIDDIEVSSQSASYNLTVNPTSLSYTADGGNQTVNVTSNTSWTATSSESWLTISPASGSNNGTITVAAAANTSSSVRTATITVSGTGVTAQTISVTQAGENVNYNLSVNPTTLSYSADGGNQTVNVTSNTSWNATSSESWLTINPASGSNDGTINVTASTNTSTSQRTAIITVSGTGVTAQTISVTQFGINTPQYTITVEANPTNGGTVTGGGTYFEGASATIEAIPNEGYRFIRWNDGNTENPRTITVTGDATYTAYFEGIPQYTITVLADPIDGGTVTGGGTYYEGTVITIAATPNQGYVFNGWNDNNMQISRTITVTEDATYTATFADASTVTLYTITVNPNSPAFGTTTGGGSYVAGTEITISGIPNNGYRFIRWNDGNTDNPRIITVTGNATYVANFAIDAGIEEEEISKISVFPNPSNGMFTLALNSMEGNVTCQIINARGSIIETREIEAIGDSEYVFDLNVSSGVYFVRIISGYNIWTERIVIEK